MGGRHRFVVGFWSNVCGLTAWDIEVNWSSCSDGLWWGSLYFEGLFATGSGLGYPLLRWVISSCIKSLVEG